MNKLMQDAYSNVINVFGKAGIQLANNNSARNFLKTAPHATVYDLTVALLRAAGDTTCRHFNAALNLYLTDK